MSDKLRFFFRKGAIDVLFYLDKIKEAGYYEIYRQGFVVSRPTFANLLKLLKDTGLVTRKVIHNRPPRVIYGLSEEGRNVEVILGSLSDAFS